MGHSLFEIGKLAQLDDQYGTLETVERKWDLIEFAATDESTPLRAGAIEELLYLLASDPERAVALFERLMEGHPALLVRRKAGDAIRTLRGEHFLPLRDFLVQYAASQTVKSETRELAEYLLEHGILDPDWTLSMVDIILGNIADTGEAFGLGGSKQLIRLVVRIYNDPTADDEIRWRSMNLFDRLMEQFAGAAHRVLAEWDRK
jgi:hypothetical protein